MRKRWESKRQGVASGRIIENKELSFYLMPAYKRFKKKLQLPKEFMNLYMSIVEVSGIPNFYRGNTHFPGIDNIFMPLKIYRYIYNYVLFEKIHRN